MGRLTSRRTGPPKAPNEGAGDFGGLGDGSLLARFAASRDEPAFAELVRRHGPMVLGVCRQLLRDPNDADDAFQGTFLVLARRARDVERPELLAHWLYGVAVRVSRKAKARSERRRRVEGRGAMDGAELVGDPGRPELPLVRREEVEALHEELSRLPERYRLPVVLCDLGGLTQAEAAERLRWPLGSLGVRRMRARELLRARLVRRGLAPTAGLFALAVLPRTSSAAVPPGLAEATVRAAVRLAPSSAGPVSGALSLRTGQLLAATAAGPATAAAAMALLLIALVAAVTAAGAVGATPRDGQTDVLSVLRAETDQPEPAQALRITPQADGSSARAQADESHDVPAVPSMPVPDATVLPAVLDEYKVLAGRVGRDPDRHVGLALWCEARGLAPERLKHLSLAILTDPRHATARGLLGQMRLQGRWRPLDEVSARARSDTTFDAARTAYRTRRDRGPGTAEAHWKLALWCEQNGLEPEARAHLTAVTRLDPTLEKAWKRLGYQNVARRWVRPEQAAAEREEAEARRKAALHWRPLLTRWRDALKDPARHAAAIDHLAGVTDLRAVPSIWSVFAGGGPGDQANAVRLLGQIDAPSASQALALLAAFGQAPETRRAAAETLVRRDPRTFAGLLVGLLRDPLRFEVLPVGGPDEPGVLFVEGERYNARRLYAPTPPPPEIRELVRQYATGDFQPMTPREWVAATTDDHRAPLLIGQAAGWRAGTVQRNVLEAQRATVAAQAQLQNDLRAIMALNITIIRSNEPVLRALRATTGQDQGEDRESWARWWTDLLGYDYRSSNETPKPTIDQIVPLAYQPNYGLSTSCFAAGTLVQTLDGPRPIESIRLGDRVLTQDPASGALAFEPVLSVAHNRPSPTVRVRLESETITATGIHRFWCAGRGWVAARDLKAGNCLRAVGGVARVRSVETGSVAPVYNLEVGPWHSFFVGRPAVLVHDDSLVAPVPRPFDSELEAGSR